MPNFIWQLLFSNNKKLAIFMVQLKNIKAPEFQKVGLRKVDAIKLLNSHGKRGSDFKTEEEVIDYLKAITKYQSPNIDIKSTTIEISDPTPNTSVIDDEIAELKKKLAALQVNNV